MAQLLGSRSGRTWDSSSDTWAHRLSGANSSSTAERPSVSCRMGFSSGPRAVHGTMTAERYAAHDSALRRVSATVRALGCRVVPTSKVPRSATTKRSRFVTQTCGGSESQHVVQTLAGKRGSVSALVRPPRSELPPRHQTVIGVDMAMRSRVSDGTLCQQRRTTVWARPRYKTVSVRTLTCTAMMPQLGSAKCCACLLT